MKKTVKTACRGYFLTDYEAEEKWLHEMNRQGWQLTATPFPCFSALLKQNRRISPGGWNFILKQRTEKSIFPWRKTMAGTVSKVSTAGFTSIGRHLQILPSMKSFPIMLPVRKWLKRRSGAVSSPACFCLPVC